jgi:hypothetical protein
MDQGEFLPTVRLCRYALDLRKVWQDQKHAVLSSLGLQTTRAELTMTRKQFITAWKEHRERILFDRYPDGDVRIGPKLEVIANEATEFWAKWKLTLVRIDVTVFFDRVLRAHKEAKRP